MPNVKSQIHIPVLQKEVLEYLNPKSNENFIDGTFGGGGHTLAILEKNEPKGMVLGIDADPELLKNAENNIQNTEYKNRLVLSCGNFANLKEIAGKEKFTNVSGIIFDLGMSSWHLEISGRGFSFSKKEPLDMRYDARNPLTAEKILNYWSSSEIEKILREFGEERFSRQIAQSILEERKLKPIKNSFQLIEILKRAVPFRHQHQKLHFATRTFQALRIAVNDELNNFKNALPQAIEILKPGGKLVVISFHSLEDRIIKNFLKEKSEENLIIILTKKPVGPQNEEIKINRRSRSAKLRAAEKL